MDCKDCEHCKRAYVQYKVKFVCHNNDVREKDGLKKYLKMPIIAEGKTLKIEDVKSPEWCPICK